MLPYGLARIAAIRQSPAAADEAGPERVAAVPVIPSRPWTRAMPKFTFNIVDDEQQLRDEEGMDLPDLEAARSEAQESARGRLADALRAHKDVNGRRIEIANAQGDVIAAQSAGHAALRFAAAAVLRFHPVFRE
jgi:hypothetical protein